MNSLEKRATTEDLYFPHNLHMETMNEVGDPCMSCHPFSPNRIKDEEILKDLTSIINEPLEAICHNCHMKELSAPSECRLCHKKMERIIPDDHRFDYIHNHTTQAGLNNSSCENCHPNPTFCTNCHFKRNRLSHQYHNSWYISDHGIDARVSTGSCGKCHNGSFCANCHERAQ